jgi:hypothetical protein
LEDGTIAATARRHELTIVTGNDKDFRRPGLKRFHPVKDTLEAQRNRSDSGDSLQNQKEGK